MRDLFTWGIWITTETPYKGRAHGAITEDKFRPLLKELLQSFNGDVDKALDRIKEIMVAELGRVK